MFHWHKTEAESAIVARSEVIGRAVAEDDWWRLPLVGFTEFEEISRADLRRRGRGSDRSTRAFGTTGAPLYLPFALSDKQPLRPIQTYLAKMPAALVEQFPALLGGRDIVRGLQPNEATDSPAQSRPVRGGRQADIEVRLAIERWAVDAAVAHLWARGGSSRTSVCESPTTSWRDEPMEPSCTLRSRGSSGTALTVELTEGEVAHHWSLDDAESVLYVLDEIRWTRTASGVRASGGRPRVWREWEPEEDFLSPLRYRYELPNE